MADPSRCNDPIIVVDHDPGWRAEFEREKARILGAIEHAHASCEHIGSTAVENLAAKPVIDIQVTAHELAHARSWLAQLTALGYIYRPEYEANMPFRLFLHLDAENRRRINLHIYEDGHDDAKRNVIFRDQLRHDRYLADAYGHLKTQLAGHYDHVNDYAAAKSPFIDAVIEAAGGPPRPDAT